MTVDPALRQKADVVFSQARRRVSFQRILGFFTGHQPDNLLSLEDVRKRLRIHGQHYAGIETIPIDKIVSSVGRYREFNRAFLPTQDHVRERWKGVYQAAHGAGFPAIDVYKIGDAYFVRDGHHRVSVLKELGADSVEATITELDTQVPLSPDVAEEDLDLKEEYAAFLDDTGLGQQRPEQRIEFTLPGQYLKLHEHIAVHRHFLGLDEQREITEGESVTRWYDDVYSPVVEVIRKEGILAQFPARTEADLYLWIIEHRHYLNERYGQFVPLKQAAADFSREYGMGEGKKQLEAETQRMPKKRDKGSQTVSVFGSGSAPAEHWVLAQAERLGQLLAEAGFSVICGGYGGTMEAVCRGANLAGGRAMGITMDLFTPPLQPNEWLTKEKRVKNFFPRLKHLTNADAFVVLRGGIGTLTETTLVWSLLQTGQISSRPFIFVGEGWHHLFDSLRAETFVTDRDFALATVVNSEDEALTVLRAALAPAP